MSAMTDRAGQFRLRRLWTGAQNGRRNRLCFRRGFDRRPYVIGPRRGHASRHFRKPAWWTGIATIHGLPDFILGADALRAARQAGFRLRLCKRERGRRCGNKHEGEQTFHSDTLTRH